MRGERGAGGRPFAGYELDLEEEIDSYLEGPCTDKAREKCQASLGPFIEKRCATCGKKDYEPNVYVHQLHQVFLFQEAGFPFGEEFANLVPFDFWPDLAVLRQKITAKMYNPVDPDPGKRPEHQRKKGRVR